MRIRPSIFLTADTHFGHAKLLAFGRQENFVDDIVRNWNEVVHKHDIVLHLGDLTFMNKEQTKEITLKLHGKKYIILGNHDDDTDKWYADCGFTVIPASLLNYKNKYDKWYNILFTHIPVHPLPEGWYNIHGHMHGRSTHRIDQFPDVARRFDVGVDANEFTPVRLYDVINKLGI